MEIKIECGCPEKNICCINKINLLKAITYREIKNHEQFRRHGHGNDEELQDMRIYGEPDKCFFIEHNKEKQCKFGCNE